MMTIGQLTFHPLVDPILAGTLLIALLTVMIFIELRKIAKFKTLRLMSIIIAVLGLAGIILRPAFTTHAVSTRALLTHGYSVDDADSLSKEYPGLEFLHLADVKEFRGSRLISSPHQLSAPQNSVQFVLGNGSLQSSLDILKSQNFDFFPGNLPEGIIQIEANNPIRINEKASIDGIFNSIRDTVKILLQTSGGIKEDSTTVVGKGIKKFSLSFMPRVSGNFLMKISADDQSPPQLFPVQVARQRSLNLLMVQKYPSFETQYVKNFLGRHHKVLLRYQLSKKAFRYEYINRAHERLDHLNEKNLHQFDMAMIDSDALQDLPSAELKSLEDAIENGLGLIILFNENPEKIKVLKSFFPNFRKINSDTANFTLVGSRKTLPAWPSTISTEANVISLLRNKNRALTGYTNKGLGKIGFQLLQETYRLSLEGDSLGYSQIWSPLIGKVARNEHPVFNLKIENEFPIFEDDPVNVKVISSGAEPVLTKDKIRLPLKEDIFVDDVWHGKFWADAPGWHELNIDGDSTKFTYYVSEKNAWASLVETNVRSQLLSSSKNGPQTGGLTKISKPLPRWIFYSMIILCLGFLWAAPKL